MEARAARVMFGWFRSRAAARQVPDALWSETLERFPFLAARDEAEASTLRALTSEFLGRKQFQGAHGFEITDRVAVAISAQAVLPVLHLGLGWYDDFVGIVVHAEEVVAQRTVVDDSGIVHEYDEVLAGEAMERGPVMLNWKDVSASGASAIDGYNVVIHEFVHKIDMRDGAPDGCPPMPSKAARKRWLATLQEAFDGFREKVIVAERFGGEAPWLDPYGAESVDEFFAVASEAYFVNRPRFATEFPPLLALFDGFYRPGRAVPRT